MYICVNNKNCKMLKLLLQSGFWSKHFNKTLLRSVVDYCLLNFHIFDYYPYKLHCINEKYIPFRKTANVPFVSFSGQTF